MQPRPRNQNQNQNNRGNINQWNQGNNANNQQNNANQAVAPEMRANRTHFDVLYDILRHAGFPDNVINLFRVGELPTAAEIARVTQAVLYDAIAALPIAEDRGMIPIMDLIGNGLRNQANAPYAGMLPALLPYLDRPVVWDQINVRPVQAGALFDRIARYQDFAPIAVHNVAFLRGNNIVNVLRPDEAVMEDGRVIERVNANIVNPEIPVVNVAARAGALFGHAYRLPPTQEELCNAMNIPNEANYVMQLRARIASVAVGGQNYLCTREDLLILMGLGDYQAQMVQGQIIFLAEHNANNDIQNAMPLHLAPIPRVAGDEEGANNAAHINVYINAIPMHAPAVMAAVGDIHNFIARYYGWLQGAVVLNIQRIIRFPVRERYNIINALNAVVNIAPLIVCIASVAANLQPRMTFHNVVVWQNMNIAVVDAAGVHHLVSIAEAAAAIYGNPELNQARAVIPFIALINNTFRPGPYVDYIIGFNFFAPRGDMNAAVLEDIFANYVARLPAGIGARRRCLLLRQRVQNFGGLPVADRQGAIRPWIALILSLNVVADRDVVRAAIADFFGVNRLGNEIVPARPVVAGPNQPAQAELEMLGVNAEGAIAARQPVVNAQPVVNQLPIQEPPQAAGGQGFLNNWFG